MSAHHGLLVVIAPTHSVSRRTGLPFSHPAHTAVFYLQCNVTAVLQHTRRLAPRAPGSVA